MTDNQTPRPPRSGYTRLKKAKEARRRGETKAERAERFAPKPRASQPDDAVPYHIHGLHAVRAAIANPSRTIHKLMATPNALQRLELGEPLRFEVETVTPRTLDALLGADTVHQGVAALIDPLPPQPLAQPLPRLSLVLDQVTDPHNVGAILRSAAAFEADAVITTTRHAARETATLAKAASGAFELVPMLMVRNLAEALETLKAAGTLTVGLDSEAGLPLDRALADSSLPSDARIALVMGAEGKGLRQKTIETCDLVARLPMTGGALASLNVSNAAVLALYIARKALADADG